MHPCRERDHAMTKAKPRVLIAEDDSGMRAVLAARLSQSGFEVVTAADGQKAIDAFDREAIDVALLDVRMPCVDGFGVCEHIRTRVNGKEIPVFFLTGATDGIVRTHLDRLTACVGGDRCLLKPCDGQHLVLLLQHALGPRRQA